MTYPTHAPLVFPNSGTGVLTVTTLVSRPLSSFPTGGTDTEEEPRHPRGTRHSRPFMEDMGRVVLPDPPGRSLCGVRGERNVYTRTL